MKEVYKKNIEMSIKGLLNETNITMQDVWRELIESLMQAERNLFLQEKNNYGSKGNGFYQRMVNHITGKFQIRVPRDRLNHFSPFMLEIIKKDKAHLDHLALQLYANGMSQKSIKEVLGECYGGKYSPAKVSELVKQFEPFRIAWQRRKLSTNYHLVMIDAINISVRRDRVSKDSFYIAIGLNKEFKREVLGLYCIPEESALGWRECLADLKERGIKNIGLVVSDELSGIKESVHNIFPNSNHQFCLLHKIKNLLSKVRRYDKAELVDDFRKVRDLEKYNDTIEQFSKRLLEFTDKWGNKYPSIKKSLPEKHWSSYCAYINYPVQVRKMIYTTNWIERLNKEIRKTTHHVNSFPNEDSALNLIFMTVDKVNNGTYKYPITTFYPFADDMKRILFQHLQNDKDLPPLVKGNASGKERATLDKRRQIF